MFYWLAQNTGFFNKAMLFSVTGRSIFALVTGLLITLIFGRPIIHWLFKKGIRSVERTYGEGDPTSKAGTPVMGGLLLLIGGLGSVLLWGNLGNQFVQILLVASLWFAGTGALDDILKIKKRNSDKGLSRAGKYLSQIGFGIGLAIILLNTKTSPWFPIDTNIYIPFYKYPVIDIGLGYALFIVLMIAYSANAVNFADGRDGLAVGPSFFVLLVLGVFAYVLGSPINDYFLANYFLNTPMPGAGEITVFVGGVAGAALGFLWYNCHPAEVFMGDTGSLFLGGVMGTAAILIKQEFIYLLAGGVFVAEILSTALQEWIGLDIFKRRILYRAPIHHSFQHAGMAEPKIVSRFWIVSALLAAVALASLKIR